MNIWQQLQGSVPLRLFWQGGHPMLEWAWAGSQPVTGAFYDHWLAGLLDRPFNQLFRPQTPLDDLMAQAGDLPPGLPVDGFIFHMSRCGSTLLARMLAALPEHRVISEPFLLQKVILNLQPDPPIPDEQRTEWLRLLVHLLASRRGGPEERMFIKFDALAGLRLDLLLRAFPDVPWVFLYRQPEEVLVSQTREIAGGMLPGYLDPGLFDSDLVSLLSMPLPEYIALALAGVCRQALAHLPHGGLAVNYRRLPAAAWDEIGAHFGLNFTTGQVDAMRAVSRYNAKGDVRNATNTAQIFTPDSQEKQAAVTPEMQQAARREMVPLYEMLEKYAAGQSQ